MGRIVVWNLMSLDGFFEGPEPWDLAFHERAWGPELRALSESFGESAEMLVFGRKTYEGMAAYWPTAEEEGRVRDYMNALPKLVASRTLRRADWNNSRVTADIAGELRAAKARAGKTIYVFGSAGLTASLLAEGLVDELMVAVVPVLLGRGGRLFRDGAERTLRLLSARPIANGTVILSYAVEAS
jgi:dihydrofolate reductase